MEVFNYWPNVFGDEEFVILMVHVGVKSSCAHRWLEGKCLSGKRKVKLWTLMVRILKILWKKCLFFYKNRFFFIKIIIFFIKIHHFARTIWLSIKNSFLLLCNGIKVTLLSDFLLGASDPSAIRPVIPQPPWFSTCFDRFHGRQVSRKRHQVGIPSFLVNDLPLQMRSSFTWIPELFSGRTEHHLAALSIDASDHREQRSSHNSPECVGSARP